MLDADGIVIADKTQSADDILPIEQIVAVANAAEDPGAVCFVCIKPNFSPTPSETPKTNTQRIPMQTDFFTASPPEHKTALPTKAAPFYGHSSEFKTEKISSKP